MIHLKAYAKINFGLRILGKREDGYHDIETIFHRVDIFDEITLSPAPSISFTSDSPDLTSAKDNLCVTAAHVLQEFRKISAGVSIQLKKKIPIGAGLGGGSSDAASTLIGLNAMWLPRRSPPSAGPGGDIQCTTEELLLLASQLGSDVSYFLRNGTAYATGRGEILEYFPLSLPYWIVVVNPDIHVSTSWAYAQLQNRKPPGGTTLRDNVVHHIGDAGKLRELVKNDFEPVVFRAHPELAEIKRRCYEQGAVFAQMSGSGSSIYGLFETEERALKMREEWGSTMKVFVSKPDFSPYD